jgi:cyanophycinase-like exopeptidase
VGASNGDEPAFYDVFRAAFEPAGITDLRMIPSIPSPDDLAFLGTADVVLLAGGDVERGWRAMRAGGLADAVIGRWTEGAVLVGVSAGAVQLGTWAWPDAASADATPLATFGIVPFAVAAHDEARGWRDLDALLRALGPGARGLCIPSGGGALVDPDGTVHPLRRPVVESIARGDGIATRQIEALV